MLFLVNYSIKVHKIILFPALCWNLAAFLTFFFLGVGIGLSGLDSLSLDGSVLSTGVHWVTWQKHRNQSTNLKISVLLNNAFCVYSKPDLKNNVQNNRTRFFTRRVLYNMWVVLFYWICLPTLTPTKFRNKKPHDLRYQSLINQFHFFSKTPDLDVSLSSPLITNLTPFQQRLITHWPDSPPCW